MNDIVNGEDLTCSGCSKKGTIEAVYSAWEKGRASFYLEFVDKGYEYATIDDMNAYKGENDIECFICTHCNKEWDDGEALAADTVGVNLEHVPKL